MSSLRPSTSRTSSTPASEKSIYFDAPLMHIFTRRRSSASINSSSRFRRKRNDDGDEDTSENVADVSGPMPNVPPSQTSATADPTEITRETPVTTAIGTRDLLGDETDRSAQDHRTSASDAATATRQRKSSASTGGAVSDSGYGSTGSNAVHKRAKTSTNRTGLTVPTSTAPADTTTDEMKPIPVVWSGEEDEESGQEQRQPQTSSSMQRSQSRMRAQSPWLGRSTPAPDVRRATSVSSFRPGERGGDQDSIFTSPSGRRTPHRRISFGGGTFAVGPGTVGPNALPELDESFEERSAAADAGLSKKQRNRLGKSEVKEGKKIAAVIRAESKAEKRALHIAMKELSEVQRMQKVAIKEEARTASSHAKALRLFRKEELEFFAARAKYERAQADLQTQEDIREACRDHAQEATELLQDKNREVEWLRAQKCADDRERELKLLKLTGKG